MEQKEKCIKARLVAIKRDGAYTQYVFQNQTVDWADPNAFVMLTRCPNWHGKEPDIMQDGFVTYKYVQAGTDTYYDRNRQEFVAYNYTAMYFLDFVPITHVLKSGYVTESHSLKVS